MINVREMVEAYEREGEHIVICVDGQAIIGRIDSVDDDDESGLGEIGISMFTPEGAYVGIGQSEIERIDPMTDEMRATYTELYRAH